MFQPVLKHISQMNDAERAQQWSYCNQFFRADVITANQAILKGRRCYEILAGNIFNSGELEEIKRKDEVAIQAQNMISKFASIMGSFKQTWKTGAVFGEGSEDAAPAEVRQSIMEDMIFPESDIDGVKMQVAQDALVTGVPTWAWIEPFFRNDIEKPGMSIVAAPWDSVIPDSGWTDHVSLSDLRRISRIKQMTYQDIVDSYGMNIGVDKVDNLKVAMEAAAKSTTQLGLNQDYLNARNGSLLSSAGFVNVVEMLYFCRTPIKVFIDAAGMTDVVPQNFTQQQIDDYLNSHKGMRIGTNTEKILWTTTWIQNGMVLDSGTHWLQIGQYPCVVNCGPKINKKPVGVIEFAADVLKELSYMRTERLQAIRTANSNVMFYKDGTFEDINEVDRQRKKTGGNVRVSMQADINRDIYFPENKYPSQVYENGVRNSEDDLSLLTVERNFEGGQQASQESSKAIGARVSQSLNKLSFFFQGSERFNKNLCRLVIKAMPFCIPDNMVVRKFDPSDGNLISSVKVNEPRLFDYDGNAVAYKNDLTVGDFDFAYTEADNSISAQEQMRAMFIDFIKNAGNLPPDYLPLVAKSYPCTPVQKFGDMLLQKQQDQQNQPPMPPKATVSISLKAEDLGQQAMMDVAKAAGIDIPQNQQPPQPQQQQQPAQQPGMPPQNNQGDQNVQNQ